MIKDDSDYVFISKSDSQNKREEKEKDAKETLSIALSHARHIINIYNLIGTITITKLNL
jgi:hypothetical protein